MEQNDIVHSIYSISYNNNIIYVGLTAHGHHRWTCHKTKARNMNQHARWIHKFMANNTTDVKKFPEFEFNIITTTTDEDTAKHLEKHFQTEYNVPSRHKQEIRPNNLPDDLETR